MPATAMPLFVAIYYNPAVFVIIAGAPDTVFEVQQIIEYTCWVGMLMWRKHAGSRRNCFALFQNVKKCVKIKSFSIFAFAGKKHQQSWLVAILAPL